MTTTYGRFRLRRAKDGAVEVWMRGWRLESQVVPLAPLAMTVAFLITPGALPMRFLGATLLTACTWVTFRFGRMGFRLTEDGVEVVDVVRTRRVAWDDLAGFMGDRGEHEGGAVLMTREGERLKTPAAFAAEDMDPYGDEGEESIVDELNRLVWSVRRGEPLPV